MTQSHKLSNEKFVGRAAEHIVAQKRERLTADQHKLDAVELNLKSLRNKPRKNTL